MFVNAGENSIHNQTLNDQVRVARKRLGIGKILTPYGLRHMETGVRRIVEKTPQSKNLETYGRHWTPPALRALPPGSKK